MNYMKKDMSKKGVRSICDIRVIEEHGKLITPTLNKVGTRYDDDVDTRLSNVWSIFFFSLPLFHSHCKGKRNIAIYMITL